MKYAIKFMGETLPIKETEIEKVIRAMEQKEIVVLECGVIHGSFIAGIVKDIHAERKVPYGYKFQGEDNLRRADFQTGFPEMMKMKKLSTQTNQANQTGQIKQIGHE